MHDIAIKLRKNGMLVAEEAGWDRPNGYGVGPVTQNRDSDILAQSNFDTIFADLRSLDDRVHVIRQGHWGFGWMEQIAVPIVPAVVERVESWVDALAYYPIADDDDHSKREYEDTLETLVDSYGVEAERAGEVFSWLFDAYSVCRSDEIDSDQVAEAIADLDAKAAAAALIDPNQGTLFEDES